MLSGARAVALRGSLRSHLRVTVYGTKLRDDRSARTSSLQPTPLWGDGGTRPPRRECPLLRPRAAGGRHSGRAGCGARCARSLEDRGRRHARGFLLDAARGVRETPRAYHPVRSGISHLLPPPRLYRSAHGDDDAAGPGDGAASAAGRRDARARGALFRPRRQTEKRARGRARRADDGVRPRSAAKEGFCADDRRRNRRGESGDAAAGFAARRSAYAALGAASATVISSTSAARCAPA